MNRQAVKQPVLDYVKDHVCLFVMDAHHVQEAVQKAVPVAAEMVALEIVQADVQMDVKEAVQEAVLNHVVEDHLFKYYVDYDLELVLSSRLYL